MHRPQPTHTHTHMYTHAPFFIPRPLSLTPIRSFFTYSIRRLGRHGLSLQGICVPSAANTFACSIILDYGHYLGKELTQASQVASQPASQPIAAATTRNERECRNAFPHGTADTPLSLRLPLIPISDPSNPYLLLLAVFCWQ